ncbi:hypothetical protein D3C80_1812400 [compost metagenome]
MFFIATNLNPLGQIATGRRERQRTTIDPFAQILRRELAQIAADGGLGGMQLRRHFDRQHSPLLLQGGKDGLVTFIRQQF